MKILVVGSLKNVPSNADICSRFVSRLGEIVVERDNILLTGCRGSLDKAIAKAAHRRLEALHKDSRQHLVGYRLKNAEPAHRLGTVHISARKDWDLTHPELAPPEQIAVADAAVFVAGREGTIIAANWARIAGIPVLGVAEFGGAGHALYELEYRDFEKKYGSAISREEFEVLNQDTPDVERLAADVVSLAERIVMPRTVFPIMPLTSQYRKLNASYREVCTELGFAVKGTSEAETTERIIPRILEGIRRSAFLIADVSEVRPNIFSEIGFAQGLGKQVVLTARTGTTLPFDVADIPVIFWDTEEGLKKQLRKRLANVVRRLRGSGSALSPRE
jgi:hypothetical protein